MAEIDYAKLYILQDQVFHTIFENDCLFYLTGGTCLHRFYVEKRYSVDLDLFTSENSLFRDEVRRLTASLKDNSFYCTTEVDTRDFVRLQVQQVLQIDLVNDRVYRHGGSTITSTGIKIDNIQNIAANKISAIMGRDEPKDVFDLYTIAKYYHIDWKELLHIADRKASIDREVLEYRLKSFPLDLLNDLAVKEREFLQHVQSEYHILVEDIIQERQNRLHSGNDSRSVW